MLPLPESSCHFLNPAATSSNLLINNILLGMYLINNVYAAAFGISRRFWNPAAASGIQLPLPQIIRYTNLDHTTGFKYVLLE